MLYKPQDLMILKLLNPDGFEGASSYWHTDGYFEFEGFLPASSEVFTGYSGIEFGDDEYFMIHTILHGHEEFDYRHSDYTVFQKRPWVVFATGCEDLYGMFFRFESYTEMCEWLEHPYKTNAYVLF